MDSVASSFLFSPATLLAVSFLLLSCYLLYLWALPKPIPGIPYNKEATKHLLGDIPQMVKHVTDTKEVFTWLAMQNVKLDSPIVQLFCRPFQKPWVVVTDFRESQDMMARRTKEFDRSPVVGDAIGSLAPNFHIALQTGDEFKAHRRLLQDLMIPAFLHQVAAPQIYTAFEGLINLWDDKLRLAQGRPFNADNDIFRAALDAIWAATFGTEIGTMKAQTKFLSSVDSVELGIDVDKEAILPEAPSPPTFEALITLMDSAAVNFRSPIPKLHHWIIRQMKYFRSAKALKDNLIVGELEKAKQRFSEDQDSKGTVKSALEHVVLRELAVAAKEGRPPAYKSTIIQDELWGFIMGGHDTTATALAWTVKLLADHPEVQSRLRRELLDAMPEAASSKRVPTVLDITKLQNPYLDATIEECLRCANTSFGTVRRTMVDTEILGYRVPKGTDVYLLNRGADFVYEGFQIDEKLRSPSSQAAKGRYGSWDPKTMAKFDPTRWLKTDENGNVVYDPMAGQINVFGYGPRACFGKRMAYLEMRIVLALLIWNFELQKAPEKYSSYAAVDMLTHRPQQSYVRLARIPHIN